jgi:predicted  nucleic acid-binding Zn-ribbon protein
MSNQDYDPRMRNGWAEYQRLVLAELERHNTLIETLNTKLNDISLQIALLKQENGKIGALDARIAATEKRLDKIDQGDMVEGAINKYKAWLLSGGLLLITAVALPLVKIFFGVG